MKTLLAFILTATVALSMMACAAKETVSAESSASTSEVTSKSSLISNKRCYLQIKNIIKV